MILFVAKGERQRRLHKALLRYHDPANWALIRQALVSMGKKHLIGNRPGCLVPPEGAEESVTTLAQKRGSGRHAAKRFATKHPNQPDIRKDGKRGNGGNGANNSNDNGNNNRPGQRDNQNRNGRPNNNGNNKPAGNRNGNKPAQGQGRNKPAGQKPTSKFSGKPKNKR